jgi:hypothetical protein
MFPLPSQIWAPGFCSIMMHQWMFGNTKTFSGLAVCLFIFIVLKLHRSNQKITRQLNYSLRDRDGSRFVKFPNFFVKFNSTLIAFLMQAHPSNSSAISTFFSMLFLICII